MGTVRCQATFTVCVEVLHATQSCRMVCALLGAQVRGIVAAKLGLLYIGIDMSSRQAAAHTRACHACGLTPRISHRARAVPGYACAPACGRWKPTRSSCACARTARTRQSGSWATARTRCASPSPRLALSTPVCVCDLCTCRAHAMRACRCPMHVQVRLFRAALRLPKYAGLGLAPDTTPVDMVLLAWSKRRPGGAAGRSPGLLGLALQALGCAARLG